MHESVSRDARDNVGIMDRLLEYDHKKINCLILLDGKKVETANSLQHVQNGKLEKLMVFTQSCSVSSDFSPILAR